MAPLTIIEGYGHKRSWVIILFLQLTIFSCAKKPTEPDVELGKANVSELLAVKGKPLNLQQSSMEENANIFVFADDTKYQIEGQTVTGFFRTPQNSNEKKLQYWRQIWDGHGLSYRELPETRDVHGQTLFQLKSEKDNKSVLYDPQKGLVLRIIEYKKIEALPTESFTVPNEEMVPSPNNP